MIIECIEQYRRRCAVVAMAVTVATVLHGCIAPAAAAGLGVVGGAAGLTALEYVEGSKLTEEALYFAGKECAVWGLKKIPAADQATAAKIGIDVCSDSIAYLQSGTLPTAAMINQILTDKFKTLHPQLVSEIQLGAWVLSKFVPSGDVILSSAEIADLVSFLGGIQQGCQTFMVNPQVACKQKYTLHKSAVKKGDTAPEFPNWFGAQ